MHKIGMNSRVQSPVRSPIEYVFEFQGAECSKTLDRVYSILGLCKDPPTIKVDYSIDPTTL